MLTSLVESEFNPAGASTLSFESLRSLLLQQVPNRLRPYSADEHGDGENADTHLADGWENQGWGVVGIPPPHGADDIEVVVESSSCRDECHDDAGPELGIQGE